MEPHLNSISLTGSSSNTTIKENEKLHDNIPTLVLVLAVSGGCDSIALFHSILALTERRNNACCLDASFMETEQQSQEQKGEACQRHHHHPFWLCLGSNERKGTHYHPHDKKTIRSNNHKQTHDDYKVPCEIHVAHFNHEQRGENSDGDETLVRNLCMEYDIPFHCYSWSKDLLDDGTSNSIDCTNVACDDCDEMTDVTNDESSSRHEASFSQNTARKWRQRRLLELLSNQIKYTESESRDDDNINEERSLQKWGAIITAHHRDDADETILLKLLRGSHLTNLWGMEPRSTAFDLHTFQGSSTPVGESKVANNNNNNNTSTAAIGYFAKPMLGIRKSSVLEYLTSNSFEWRDDESNSSNKYKRNKVRNELIPLLNEIAGGERALQVRINNNEEVMTVLCSTYVHELTIVRNLVLLLSETVW